MRNTYLLENCAHCNKVLNYIKNNPNINVSSTLVSKQDIPYIKKNDNRFGEFPVFSNWWY